MPSRSRNCRDPDCGASVKYWQVHCRCGQFVGFPNYRAATAERDALITRYSAARDECEARGVLPLLSKLEILVEQSKPVVAMSFAACDNILRSDKYRNYHQRTASGERDPASDNDHAEREIIGARLFPMYHQHIHYAVLSPDGHGLLSYGPVSVCWEVTSAYLGRRASLLDQNSYFFFDHFELGRRKATLPQGHRATWEDRTKLAVAKLAGHLDPATSDSSLSRLLMRPGSTRQDDDFIEIAIYADHGLDTQDVIKVTLERAATTPAENYRLELVRETCGTRRIVLVE